MSEYPEHEKVKKVREMSQSLGEFLDWLRHNGYDIGGWSTSERAYRRQRITNEETGEITYEVTHEERFEPVHKTIQVWLAEWLDIDLAKIDAEKEAMLDALRAQRA